MIYWKDCDPAHVERAVKMLVRELYPSAQGIDGRGGDGGRDIVWNSPDGLVIFEVKSHTDRLTRGQKNEIEGSLTKAATHDPVRWVLIVPLEPSRSEESWFDGLRRSFSEIELEWWGRDWLDGHFAARPHFQRYVEGPRSELLQRAMEYRQEEDVLSRGLPDVASRLGRLGRHARELSLFWRLDMATYGDQQVFRLSPRVPGAAALDPIKITPVFTFPADDAEAADTAQQLQQTFDYGGSVTIPGRYIDRINIDASEEARRLVDAREEITQVELISEVDNEGLPLPCTVDVETLTGEVVSSLTVQLQRRVSGRRGVTVSGSDASGVLTMTQLVDHPPAARAPGSVTFDIRSPVDHWPWAVRPVADFLLAWAPGNCISLRLGTATIGSAVISESLNVDRLQLLARVVVALDELQQRFGTQFPIPDGMTYEDLRELEMLRELFDEGRARWVDRGFTANIRADRIEGFLAIQPVEARAMRVEHEQLGFVYGNHHFDLGPVRLYAPKMLLMNRAEIEAAVGVGIDPQARWECVDGEHIYLERLTSTGEPDQAVAS